MMISGSTRINSGRTTFPFLVWLLAVSLMAGMAGPVAVEGAEDKIERTQGQMDVTVIHVDKFGVYVPDIVFYWDSSLNKQKIAALTSVAERLRNKRATLTYSARGSPIADRRPLVIDIHPYREPVATYEGVGSGAVAPRPLQASIPAASTTDRAEGAGVAEPFPARDIDSVGSQGWGRDDSPADEPSEAPTQVSAQSLPIQKRDALMLVEHMLHLTSRKSLDSILYYYADSVNYYARGDVAKDYIRRDLGYYFKNWDRIRSSLEGDIQLIDTSRPDIKVVRFQSSYEVENATRSVSGTADNTWKVQRTRTGLKVIDQKQSVLSSRTVDKP
jgi:hypothetical protein